MVVPTLNCPESGVDVEGRDPAHIAAVCVRSRDPNVYKGRLPWRPGSRKCRTRFDRLPLLRPGPNRSDDNLRQVLISAHEVQVLGAQFAQLLTFRAESSALPPTAQSLVHDNVGFVVDGEE